MNIRPRYTSPYSDLISAIAPGYDPRHIEAYMRLEHSTLDGLTRDQFEFEVAIGVACINEGGIDAAERCAQSYGM